MPLPISTGLELAGTVVTEAFTELAPIQPDRSGASLERRYTNGASEFVRVDDARIHYRAEGPTDGPTLLAIHGGYSSLHTWEGWAERLRDRVRVVRLDMPGFGLTGPRATGSHTLASLVDVVGRFCDELGLSEVAVAGNSLGGAVAWRLAADRPELVSRLLLLDAGGASLLSTLARNYRVLGSDVVPRYFTPRIVVRMLLWDAYGDPSKVTGDLVTRYHDLILRRGNRRAVIELANNYQEEFLDDHEPRFQVGTPALPSTTDSSPAVYDGYDVSDVRAPTLFQWGDEDRWLPVSFGRELAARVSDHRFVTYDGVGHVPMEEAPAPTAADAAAFLLE